MNIDDTLFTPNQSGETTIELTDELTEKEKNLVKELYDSAIANYQKYLELNPNADDKQEVETNIQKIQEAQNPNRKQAID
jgi:type III secretory pathway component EscR